MRGPLLWIISLAFALVSMFCATYVGDYTWILVSGASMVLLFLPNILRMDADYRGGLVGLTILPSLLMILIVIIDFFTDALTGPDAIVLSVSYYNWISAVIKGTSAMISGLMFMALLHEIEYMKMSRSWSVIFAMFFALTISVICMFSDLMIMYLEGYTIMNHGINYPPELAYVNGRMMSTPVVSAFLDAILVLVFLKKREYTRMEGSE